jgi:hypothetical protein
MERDQNTLGIACSKIKEEQRALSNSNAEGGLLLERLIMVVVAVVAVG